MFVKDISQAFTCTHQINDLMNSKNIWSSLYNSSKEKSFEDHSNAPLIFVLVQILTMLYHF